MSLFGAKFTERLENLTYNVSGMIDQSVSTTISNRGNKAYNENKKDEGDITISNIDYVRTPDGIIHPTNFI